MDPESTIAAVSTPPGEGGIGIVRISGTEAVSIADSLFRPATKGLELKNAASHTLIYGQILSSEGPVDEVLVSVMRAPKTYTREDTVEINCHGGIIPLRQTLSLVVEKGARLAEPGEFTARAFLNGRIDLSQAEAVADLINSKTEMAGRLALSHLNGDLKAKVDEIRDRISFLQAEVEGAIEFPDDVPLDAPGRARSAAAPLLAEIRSMIATGSLGAGLRDGLKLSIVGRPNVGKSSLFNALLGENRVIVNPKAGTTRDIVESSVSIGGIPVILADTAGIGEDSEEDIEREAMRRSFSWAEKADVVLVVLDGAEPLSRDDAAIIDRFKQKTLLVALNKSDLPCRLTPEDVRSVTADAEVLQTSALSGGGLEALRKKIFDSVWAGSVENPGSIIVSNERHIKALRRAETALAEVAAPDAPTEGEIIALNLRCALDALGEITGATADEGMLDRIFSKFCIGK